MTTKQSVETLPSERNDIQHRKIYKCYCDDDVHEYYYLTIITKSIKTVKYTSAVWQSHSSPRSMTPLPQRCSYVTCTLWHYHSRQCTLTVTLWHYHSRRCTLTVTLWHYHSRQCTLSVTLWHYHSRRCTLSVTLWHYHSRV